MCPCAFMPRILEFWNNSKTFFILRPGVYIIYINIRASFDNSIGFSNITFRRTYLIANEWNELQSYRKTSITTQTLTLLLLLEYFSFGDYAKIQPGLDRCNHSSNCYDLNIWPEISDNQPAEFSESRMSRFAIDISFYLLIALTQWLVQVLIIEKIADPFHNFMDLCSVANVRYDRESSQDSWLRRLKYSKISI